LDDGHFLGAEGVFLQLLVGRLQFCQQGLALAAGAVGPGQGAGKGSSKSIHRAVEEKSRQTFAQTDANGKRDRGHGSEGGDPIHTRTHRQGQDCPHAQDKVENGIHRPAGLQEHQRRHQSPMHAQVEVEFPVGASRLGHARLNKGYHDQQDDDDPAQRDRERRVESQPHNAGCDQYDIAGRHESNVFAPGGHFLGHGEIIP